jgi:hypothetical protein
MPLNRRFSIPLLLAAAVHTGPARADYNYFQAELETSKDELRMGACAEAGARIEDLIEGFPDESSAWLAYARALHCMEADDEEVGNALRWFFENGGLSAELPWELRDVEGRLRSIELRLLTSNAVEGVNWSNFKVSFSGTMDGDLEMDRRGVFSANHLWPGTYEIEVMSGHPLVMDGEIRTRLEERDWKQAILLESLPQTQLNIPPFDPRFKLKASFGPLPLVPPREVVSEGMINGTAGRVDVRTSGFEEGLRYSFEAVEGEDAFLLPWGYEIIVDGVPVYEEAFPHDVPSLLKDLELRTGKGALAQTFYGRVSLENAPGRIQSISLDSKTLPVVSAASELRAVQKKASRQNALRWGAYGTAALLVGYTGAELSNFVLLNTEQSIEADPEKYDDLRSRAETSLARLGTGVVAAGGTVGLGLYIQLVSRPKIRRNVFLAQQKYDATKTLVVPLAAD